MNQCLKMGGSCKTVNVERQNPCEGKVQYHLCLDKMVEVCCLSQKGKKPGGNKFEKTIEVWQLGVTVILIPLYVLLRGILITGMALAR